MKKNFLKTFIIFISFFITMEISYAKLYTDELMDTDEEVIKCDYYNKKQDETIRIALKKRDGMLTVDMTKNFSKNITEKIVPTGGTKPSNNGMNKGEIIQYLATKGKCPAYAANFDDKYLFADESADLDGNSYILEKKSVLYDKDYCFYRFSEKDWGFFLRKDKLSELANNYEGQECPATIITELEESLQSDYPRKFYGTDAESGMAITVLEKQCVSDTMNFFNDDSSAGIKCYQGKKEELKSNNPYKNQNMDPNTPNGELDCNGLFDAESKKFITGAYFIIEIIAVIFIVILTIKDYSFAILSSNQDEMKKNNKKLLTRVGILVALLLLPAILRLILRVFKIEAFNSDPLCGTVEKNK